MRFKNINKMYGHFVLYLFIYLFIYQYCPVINLGSTLGVRDERGVKGSDNLNPIIFRQFDPKSTR